MFSLGICIVQAVSGNLPWGNRLDNVVVAHHIKKGKLPPRPEEFTNAQWQLVENMCKPQPSERLNLLVVVQRLKAFADTRKPKSMGPLLCVADTEKYLDEAIDAVKHFLVRENANADTRVARQVYGLVIDRIEDLNGGDNRNIKDSLVNIAETVKEWVLQLQEQQPTVELVKTVFRGFSLHRQLDRVLAELKVKPSGDVHEWTDKCLEMLRTGAASKAAGKPRRWRRANLTNRLWQGFKSLLCTYETTAA